VESSLGRVGLGWVGFGRGFGRYQCSVRAYVGGCGRLSVFGWWWWVLFLAFIWEHRALIPVRVGWKEGFIDLVSPTSNASFACNKELFWLLFILSLAFVFG